MLAIAEVAHLVQTRLGSRAEVRFLGDFASGAFVAEPVTPADWLRVAHLVWECRDLHLGTVDASVIALAERYAERKIATLDRRHFTVVRPTHASAFELLP